MIKLPACGACFAAVIASSERAGDAVPFFPQPHYSLQGEGVPQPFYIRKGAKIGERIMHEVRREAGVAGETVVVRMKGRRVGCASIPFIRWLKERVPRRQLRPELAAMVDWYDKERG